MIEHDVSVYNNDPYEKENLLSMTNYVNLIDKYSSDKSSFLELGIGHSKTIELLSQKFKNVTVLDGEKELVNKYNKIYPTIDFVETYFEWVELFEKCNMEVEVSHGLFLKPFTTQQIHSLNLDSSIYTSLGSTAHIFPEISNSCFFILKNRKD